MNHFPDYRAAGYAIMMEIERDLFWITRSEQIGKLAVVAALRFPLFRRATAAERATYDHEVEGPYVQVWGEGTFDENDWVNDE